MRKHPEKKIENWLKKNLELFEEGMQFIKQQYRYVYINKDFKKYIQIDILAKDKLGVYVIIEIKRIVNAYTLDEQLKFYMDKFPYYCRGIIASFSKPYKLLRQKLPSNISVWNIKEKYNAQRQNVKQTNM